MDSKILEISKRQNWWDLTGRGNWVESGVRPRGGEFWRQRKLNLEGKMMSLVS